MIVSYHTDVGRVRRDNQDSVYTGEISFDANLFVVCDGMGGHNGGQTASRMATNEIARYIGKNYYDGIDRDGAQKLLLDAIDQANFSIYSESFKNPEFEGMGTTAVIALVVANSLYVANVGDSRLYLLSDSKLRQVTNDHSYVRDLISKGFITEKEAKNHPQKNVITRAVGTEDHVNADFFSETLKPDDALLLCSDGLYSMVDEHDMEKILKDDVRISSQKLVDLANEHGGRDNISAIVVKMN